MYVVNVEILQVGDILLEKHDQGDPGIVRESKIIRQRSDSHFSHALLYAGYGSVFESNVAGVQANNIQRRLYELEDDVMVLRPISKPQGFEETVVEYVRRMAMQGYADKDYNYTRSKPDTPSEPNRQFCTRFVALAYQYAGVSITDNPSFANPRDVELSNNLIKITNCLREAKDEEVVFAESDGVLCHQADYNWELLNNVRIAVHDDEIQTIEQLTDFVVSHPEHDDTIAEIVENSNYYSMWRTMEKETPWDYDAELLKEHYGTNCKYAAESLIKLAEDAILRFEYMQFQFMLGDLYYDRHTFKVFWSLYKDLVISSNKRLVAARKVLLEE